MKYRAVIFDLDDTLLCSVKAKWAQHQALASERYDLVITEETLLTHWGKRFDVMIAAIYGDVDTVENIKQGLMENDHRFPKTELAGTAEVTRRVLSAGREVGIVTSAPGFHARADLQRLGFPHDQFFLVQGEGDSEFHKPHPDVFKPALELLMQKGIDRGQVLYVGDLLIDHQTAINAGVDFVAVTTGIAVAEDFHGAGVVNVLAGLDELAQMLI